MASHKRPLFCLIDASAFIFRAFYAVRPLSNKSGLPTNAVFGFAQMIIKILEDLRPTHIAVVYDAGSVTFRKEMYDQYKANRSAMPEDLVPQIPYIKKFVECLHLPSFELAGFEADDVIGTLADRAAHLSSDQADVAIVSSDKDLMQLVNDRIYLYDTMKDVRYFPEQVKEKLGVLPELVADYLGIVGDTSDNIPGVKGIGPKGAVALLEQFGSMEAMYENLDQVKKDGQRKSLAECKDIALLSKKLATVKRDLPLELDWHALECQPKAGEAFMALMQELEFHALEKRMGSWAMDSGGRPVPEASAGAQDVPHTLEAIHAVPAEDLVAKRRKEYRALRTLAELKEVLKSLDSAPVVAFDTETTSLAIHDAALVGFSFSADGETSYYVPVGHVDAETEMLVPNQVPRKEAVQLFGDFLSKRKIAGQNLKYDLNVLRNEGYELAPEVVGFDSMIASYILEPESRHGLDLLALKYLGHKNIAYEDLCGTGKNQISFSRVSIEKALEYAAEDSQVAFLLMEILAEKLGQVPSIQKVFAEIELPLVPVLADIEWEGVAVDIPHLQAVSHKFSELLVDIEKNAFEAAGGEFNMASPKQLSKILFEDLKLPVIKKTKTGFSTDVEVLEKLAPLHKLPALILEARELTKLKSTYVDVLPTLVHPETGRVHASFNQTVAATGRLSSSDPNLQNIPIRTESGKLVRQGFVAQEGNLLVGADYSQIELRILASMSGDELLTNAFRENQDVHSLTAHLIFGSPIDKVSSDERRKAKAINFGLLYGKSAFSLSEELHISRGEAADIIKAYFARYPTIRQFLDQLSEDAKRTGYAETLFGRRRKIEGIHSKNKMILSGAERMAVNTPIQGTAADLVKIAMVKLFHALKEAGLKSKIIMQVHDELVLEVPAGEEATATKLVKECMESAGGSAIKVPLTVDVASARDWLSL
jgi:DNA polymerase-1